MAITPFGFKNTKRRPRQFEYKPLHYDPDQEARDERRRELLGDRARTDSDGGGYVPGQHVREGMVSRRGMGHGRDRRNGGAGLRRALIYLVLLGALLWWILN